MILNLKFINNNADNFNFCYRVYFHIFLFVVFFFLIAFLIINVEFLPVPHRFLSLDPKLLEEEVLTAPC